MSKSTVDTVDLSTLQYGLVRVEEAAEVADLVNSSFQKDAFFKKPEYINRTSHQGMLDHAVNGFEKKNTFLVGRVFDTVLQIEVPVTAINVYWTETSDESGIISVKCEFGCVAVWPHMEKRGLGKTLIIAAEKFLLKLFRTLNKIEVPETEASTCSLTRPADAFTPLTYPRAHHEHYAGKCTMEMVVLNVRPELVPWYSRQDYTIFESSIPLPSNYTCIVRDGFEVFCTLMKKTLV